MYVYGAIYNPSNYLTIGNKDIPSNQLVECMQLSILEAEKYVLNN